LKEIASVLETKPTSPPSFETRLACAEAPQVVAVEHVRRMRGGAQPHLMRCSDGGHYVVKFLDNPQHPRVLANEWIGAWLATRLGLPVPETAVVEVPGELIDHSDDLVIDLGRGRRKVRAGLQFGSRYPGDPNEMQVYDFLPDERLAEVENLSDFLGMLVFDKWTCNTDGRQAVFYRPQGSLCYRALMIDQGFCFNAGEWDFPDAPLRGLYARTRVYQAVTGIESFEPWLERLEEGIGERILDKIMSEVPPEWYEFDKDALYQLLDQLWARRHRVRDLIFAARDTYRRPFPNWK
jgi:HipA-like kinase